MKICQNRKSTHTVMNNNGYGALKIIRNGLSLLVPKEWLFTDGTIKKYAQKNIDKRFKELELILEQEIA